MFAPNSDFLNYQVYQQTDRVKLIEDNLSQCQRRIIELRLEHENIRSELVSSTSRPIQDRLASSEEKIMVELSNEIQNEEHFKSKLENEQLKLEQVIIQKSKLDEIDTELKSHEDEIQEFRDCYAIQRAIVEDNNANNSISTLEKTIEKVEQRSSVAREAASKQLEDGLKARKEMLHLINETARRVNETKTADLELDDAENARRVADIQNLKTELKENREEISAIYQRKMAALARKAERDKNKPPKVKEKTQMTEGQLKREAYIKQQLNTRKQEELLDFSKLPRVKKEQSAIEKAKSESKKSFDNTGRRMTLFDGTLMAAIMDMETQNNNKDAAFVGMLKSKGRAKKWRKRASLKRNSGVVLEKDDVNPEDGARAVEEQKIELKKTKKKTKAELLQMKKDNQKLAQEEQRRKNAKNRIKNELDRKSLIGTQSFAALPPEFVFADYLLDTEYTIKIELTNRSHQINSVRYHSLSDSIIQVCEPSFTPAGALSPGMSTSFKLKFKNSTNEIIHGFVKFETPAGFFQVPVSAMPPKVDPTLSPKSIDFRRQQTGEKIKRIIELENHGALRGKYEMTLELDDEAENEDMIEELSLTPENGGVLNPHEKINLTLIFCPKSIGIVAAKLNIKVLTEEDKIIEVFTIPIKGETLDLPISVSESEFDMNVCTYGFLYQDQFTISNSAKTVRVITFHVPPEAGNMLQVLPKTGYVQAESSLTAQIKFQPDEEKLQDESCSEFYDPDTGVIEFPVILTVANQAQPIHLFVYGIITGYDIELSETKIHFGPCTIYESVTKTISIANNTMLSQEYGFLDLPTFVNIRPNSGFGTILPNEELNLELVFSAPEAGEYTFEIVFQTIRGFRATIECTAIGVRTALVLSDQYINFNTALHDTHRLSFYLTNSHIDGDEYKHPVARIGKEAVFPVGPTSFCFMFPDDCGFTFSPAVGTIMPGEYKFITIMFSPQLNPTDLSNMHKKLELELKMAEEGEQDRGLGRKESIIKIDRKKSSAGMRRKKSEVLISIAGKAKAINKNSKFFWQARDYLTRIYQSNEDIYQIPCFIAPGIISMSKTTSLEYRNENCLWIEVRVNRLRPGLVVKSSGGADYNPDAEKESVKGDENGEKKPETEKVESRPVLELQSKDSKEENVGKTSLDFESQPVGTTTKKTIIIENISDDVIDMQSSLLDPHGSFTMLNPLCELEPGETHSILLTFSPGGDKIYNEVLHIYQPQGEGQQDACLNLSLRGVGMMPTCNLTAPQAVDDAIVFPPICKNGFSEQNLNLQNTSRFPIQFRIYMDSQNTSQMLLNPDRAGIFTCDPPDGLLEIGDETQLTVRFNPAYDKTGYFQDNLVLRLFGDNKKYGEFKLCGMVVDHPLYYVGLTISTLPDIIETAESRPMSQLSKASSKKSRILPIQSEKLELSMDLIEIEDDDEEIIDSYYEGSFTISCVSKLPEKKEVDEPPSKQSAPKAKKDQKPPPRHQMSYSVGSMIEDFDIEQAGIEISNADSEVDFGATKEGFHFLVMLFYLYTSPCGSRTNDHREDASHFIKGENFSKTITIKAQTLKQPFTGLKIILYSDNTYLHQLVLRPLESPTILPPKSPY